MVDPFADAQAWYDRAQKHIAEYRQLANAQQIWTIHRSQPSEGVFEYSLRFNRNLLVELKPIAGEAANALFQALDNIIGVAARQTNVKRGTQIGWPWAIEPIPDSKLPGAVRPAITSKLKTLDKAGLPQAWLTLIEETFAAPAVSLPHIDVVKEVSLSGKHWELVPTKANALAIAWTPQGSTQQVVVNIPEDYFEVNDEFIFHKGDSIDVYIQAIVKVTLAVSKTDFQPEPVFAFEATSRFVMTALQKARRLWEAAVH